MNVRLSYELHLHSCLSPCGEEEMTPRNIAGMAMLCGTRIAALTDHNTTANCPAFFAACREYGVVPVAGMELTTAEEIHMVCLFATLDEAMAFGDFVAEHRSRVKNRPDIFGHQWVIDERDEVVREDPDLLIPATDLDMLTARNVVFERGGAAFPAHVDRPSGGVIAILGDLPPEPPFAAVEFADYDNVDPYLTRYPNLRGKTVLCNSDAHRLEAMRPQAFTVSLDLPENFERSPQRDALVRRALIARLRGE